MESFAEKITRLRMEKGISKADMSRACGITQTGYANIENDVTKSISVEIGKKIAKTLGVRFNELFDVESGDQAVEPLKAEIEELKARIAEKDLLIKSVTSQQKYTKSVLIAEIYLMYFNKIEKIRKELETCNDENIRKELNEEIALLQKSEKRRFKQFVVSGVLEQNDIDEYYDRIREMNESYLEDRKYQF